MIFEWQSSPKFLFSLQMKQSVLSLPSFSRMCAFGSCLCVYVNSAWNAELLIFQVAKIRSQVYFSSVSRSNVITGSLFFLSFSVSFFCILSLYISFSLSLAFSLSLHISLSSSQFCRSRSILCSHSTFYPYHSLLIWILYDMCSMLNVHSNGFNLSSRLYSVKQFVPVFDFPLNTPLHPPNRKNQYK